MPLDGMEVSRETLCAAIRQAIALADGQGDTLTGALLMQALDAAHCGGEPFVS